MYLEDLVRLNFQSRQSRGLEPRGSFCPSVKSRESRKSRAALDSQSRKSRAALDSQSRQSRA